MRIRRALPQLALPARAPRSVRRLGYLAALLVSTLLVLVILYLVAGGLHPVMGVSVVPVATSLLAHYARKKHGLHGQVDNPTKPERFYH